jgi:hypothetical protein
LPSRSEVTTSSSSLEYIIHEPEDDVMGVSLADQLRRELMRVESSSLNTSEALSALLDRQHISDCLLRYARGVDRLDVDLIRSSFWPDARDAHGPVNGSVDDFLNFFLPRQDVREAAQHLVMNHLVVLDGAMASSEAYFISVAKAVGRVEVEMVGGRYLDQFERRHGEWRISSRLVLLDWQCLGDGAGMAERLARSHGGARNPADPSYRSHPPLSPPTLGVGRQ